MAKDKNKNMANDAVEATAVETESAPKKRGPRKGQIRGPVIQWTDARNKALGQAIRNGLERQEDGTTRLTVTVDDLAETLAQHPAFAEVARLVDRPRVHARIVTLRNQGVDIPRLAIRRQATAIDVDGLNALISGEEAQA